MRRLWRNFDKIIKYNNIKNSKILEIGCGMGTHAELLCKNVKNLDLEAVKADVKTMLKDLYILHELKLLTMLSKQMLQKP